MNKSKLLKKITELERLAPSSKPYIVFIDQLPNGKYEVREHIGVGVGNGKVLFKLVKVNKKIVSSPQDYYNDNPDLNCTVIVDDGLEDIDDDLLDELMHQASTEDLEEIVEDGELGEKYIVNQLKQYEN